MIRGTFQLLMDLFWIPMMTKAMMETLLQAAPQVLHQAIPRQLPMEHPRVHFMDPTLMVSLLRVGVYAEVRLRCLSSP